MHQLYQQMTGIKVSVYAEFQLLSLYQNMVIIGRDWNARVDHNDLNNWQLSETGVPLVNAFFVMSKSMNF